MNRRIERDMQYSVQKQIILLSFSTSLEIILYQKKMLPIITLIFINCLLDATSSPVYNMQPAYITANIGTVGRNIRNLPCISRKNNQSGVCMFAIDCLKANGTHLGTCIDRFYFGSCCHVEQQTHEILDNSIDSSIFPEREPPLRISSTEKTTTSKRPEISTARVEQTTPTVIVTSISSSIVTTTPSLSTNSVIATSESTVSKTTDKETTAIPIVTSTKTTEMSFKISTYQSVDGISGDETTPADRTSTSVPTKPHVTSHKTSTSKPTSKLTSKPTSKPMSTSTSKSTFSTKPVKLTTPAPRPKPTATVSKPLTSKPILKPATNKTTQKPNRTTLKPTAVNKVSVKPTQKPTQTPSSTAKPVSKPTSTKYSTTPTRYTTRKTTITARTPTTKVTKRTTTTKRTTLKDKTKPPLTTTPPPELPLNTNATTPTVMPEPQLNQTDHHDDVNGNIATNEIESEKPLVESSTNPLLVTWMALDEEPTIASLVNTTNEDWVPITTPDGWVLLPSVSSTTPTSLNDTLPSSTTSSTTIVLEVSSPQANHTSTEEEPTATSTSTPETSTKETNYTQNVTETLETTSIQIEVNITEMESSVNMSDFTDVCGRRMYPKARIVGGENSSFGKWPWQISLRQWRTSTYLHKCGAALLNENWAITAAHCVDSVPPSDLLLRLGEHDLSTESEPYLHQERRVQIVASHPQFDPRTFEYDLALLRFYEPVKFQPNILPVCVPQTDDDFIGSTAYVTGWGRLYEDGPLPSILQEVSVPVINNTLCESMYRTAGYIEHIPHIFICAGWRRGGFDSCEGDSGGPMVIQRADKRFLLAGVISWGIGCAEPNQPGVYTRISEFRDWINQILQF
ncbi:hypothetical protein Trydic_g5580 [Trypoxylus dichotomus]